MKRFFATIFLGIAALGASGTSAAVGSQPSANEKIDLGGPGWKLWRDASANWEKDELFLQPADLQKLPVNPPTGGWEQLASTAAVPVSVPGTVVEYLGDGTGVGTAKEVIGVSWWARTVHIPASAAGKRICLQFDSVRLRAEVYVNEHLAAYDLVGNTPFEADLSKIVQPGTDARLAVRVTNPGGNYDWKDVDSFKWGKYSIPAGHAFGGITGGVRLMVSDPVYVDDVYVQNTPAVTAVNVHATVRNTGAQEAVRKVAFVIRDKADGKTVFEQTLDDVRLAPGDNTLACAADVPTAKRWDLPHPNLYECVVRLEDRAKQAGDAAAQTFGFRWFAPDGIGTDNAVLRLNGRRIVLRTAISWGFWPINGIFPTPDLAEKQVRAARAYGLNMLNFHRCIGNPLVLDKADELGLLYFEEPGGYVSGGSDPFARALCREKLLRMVRRDRSHPSLVIFNMINEQWNSHGADKDPSLFAVHRQDLQDAHALDPSRVIVYTSSWAGRSKDPEVDPAKMHMRPFDSQVYMKGWWDYHRASGPESWKQDFYKDPTHHYGESDNRQEIVYWGEEGAISTPPRLALIKDYLDKQPHKGWDRQVYFDWYKAFDQFLDTKNLRGSFANVDDLCRAMGVVSLEHQGRKIEDTRICDANDGYAVNGWEAEIIENHSGVVDCFRNPKGDPDLIARYNRPVRVAVKARQEIVQTPARVLVDFFVLNENDLRGPHTVEIHASAPGGGEVFTQRFLVDLKGGDVFSQLAAEAVSIPIEGAPGMYEIGARLLDAAGAPQGDGRDEVFAVDWKSEKLGGRGAIYESGDCVRGFLKSQKGLDVPAFRDDLPPLDWIVVARSPGAEPVPLAGEAVQTPEGRPGLKTTFFADQEMQQPLAQRVDRSADLAVSDGATPDPAVPRTKDYGVRWEGRIIPPADGPYEFTTHSTDGVRLWIDDKQVVDGWKPGRNLTFHANVTLTAGKAVPVRFEYFHGTDRAAAHLLWQPPEPRPVATASLFERARRDGTTLILLDRAESWTKELAAGTGVPCHGSFTLGLTWVGGQYFVKKHPLFKDLPADQALNWPYQGVVTGSRFGLNLDGGELVVGGYNTWEFHLGTAVAVVPCGKGRVIVSTLNVADQLANPSSAAEVSRKLLCNYLADAMAPAHQ